MGERERGGIKALEGFVNMAVLGQGQVLRRLPNEVFAELHDALEKVVGKSLREAEAMKEKLVKKWPEWKVELDGYGEMWSMARTSFVPDSQMGIRR